MRVEPLSTRFDVREAAVVQVDARRTPDTHLTTPIFEEPPGGFSIQLIERPRRKRQGRITRSASEHAREHGGKRRRGRVVRGLVQRGKRQRLPQHLADTRRLTVVDEPFHHRLAGRCGNPGDTLPSALCSLLCLGEPYRRREPYGRKPIAPRKRVPVEQSGRKVQRRWQGWQPQPASLSRSVDEVDGQRRLHPHVAFGSEPP